VGGAAAAETNSGGATEHLEPSELKLNEWPLSAIDLTAATVRSHLLQHGHLLVRGAFKPSEGGENASGLATLREAALAALEPITYVGGAVDREERVGGVYEAGSEPAHLNLAFHNEMAYLRHAVRVIAFGCIRPAATEGAGRTTIADNREALRLLPLAMARRMAAEGVMYEQRLSNGDAPADVPVYKTWQQAFATTARAEVESHLRHQGQQFEWRANGSLAIKWTRPAFAQHPDTGERLMFHAILSGHSSWYNDWPPWDQLDTSMRPWHSQWGDGTEFSAHELRSLRLAYETAASHTVFDWREGDLLILDNMRFVHGRSAFDDTERSLGVLLGGFVDVDA